ncbi:MAG: FAD-dependent oxidoreductase [Pseudomonadota bacterium]
MKPSVAIVGAGIAGLTLARRLGNDAAVTVFEKSRGLGGRMATRYADPFRFDHGAQFFTIRDPHFRAFLQPLMRSGIIAIWPARFVEFHGPAITARRAWDHDYPHYVGVPGMNAIGQALGDGLSIVRETRVERLQASDGGWVLHGPERDLGRYDWVLLTAPQPQALALLPAPLANDLPAAPLLGCYSLMLGFTEALPFDWDAALIKDADISWASINSSKPGRAANPTMLVHATNRWADANLDADQDWVREHLLAETKRVTGLAIRPAHVGLHRWRYANIAKQSGPAYHLVSEARVGVCGDWFVRGRIEAAFQSATGLADALHAAWQ